MWAVSEVETEFEPAPRKLTVEESLAVAIEDIHGHIFADSAGGLTWTSGSGHKTSVEYFVAWEQDKPIFTLQNRWCDSEIVRIPIPLQSTSTRFGRERWCFSCQLILNGASCDRRVEKIYFPPGAEYFGCRVCYKLAYRSSQEAHRDERRSERIDRVIHG
jgi:hypothetical protein